jgi:hypothetical protein
MSPPGSKNAPEAKAREKIDLLLEQAGWLVQDREDTNLTAAGAIAVREFKLEKGHATSITCCSLMGVPLAWSRPSPRIFTDERRVSGHKVRQRASRLADDTVQTLTVCLHLDRRRDGVHQHTGPATALAPRLQLSSAGDVARVVGRRHTRRVAQAVRRLLHSGRRHQAIHAPGTPASDASD